MSFLSYIKIIKGNKRPTNINRGNDPIAIHCLCFQLLQSTEKSDINLNSEYSSSPTLIHYQRAKAEEMRSLKVKENIIVPISIVFYNYVG